MNKSSIPELKTSTSCSRRCGTWVEAWRRMFFRRLSDLQDQVTELRDIDSPERPVKPRWRGVTQADSIARLPVVHGSLPWSHLVQSSFKTGGDWCMLVRYFTMVFAVMSTSKQNSSTMACKAKNIPKGNVTPTYGLLHCSQHNLWLG